MRKIFLGSVIVVLVLSMNSFTGDSVEGRAGARFTGVFSDSGIDRNGDGYFEQLVVSGEIQIDSCLGIVVAGRLCAQDGQIISVRPDMYYTAPLSRAELVSDSGKTVFHVFFSGEDIRWRKTDGPFETALWLACEGSSSKVAETTYETSAYSHKAFRETPAEQDEGIVFGMGPLGLVGMIVLVVLGILLFWRILRKRTIRAS